MTGSTANASCSMFGRVDDCLRSRLRASEHVHLDQYHDHQLVDILAARVICSLLAGLGAG